MIFIANISTPQHTYNVHLEVGDDDAGRAKVAEALADIQQRFVPRSDPKKPAPQRPAATPQGATQPQGGEGGREK